MKRGMINVIKNDLKTPQEVSKILNVEASLLRKYCVEFNIQTKWTKPENSGHRRFTKENIEDLKQITKLIQEEKLTWKETRDFINGNSEIYTGTESKTRLEKKIDDLEEKIDKLIENDKIKEDFIKTQSDILIEMSNMMLKNNPENQALKQQAEAEEAIQQISTDKKGEVTEKNTDKKGIISRIFKRK